MSKARTLLSCVSLVSLPLLGACPRVSVSGDADLCRDVSCSGHGSCVPADGGGPTCACEPGFRPLGLECVVDEPDGGPGDGGHDADHDTDYDWQPPLEDVLIYAHSRDTLYTFSPFTLTVEEIGPFRLGDNSPAPYMLDLAVDANGEVFTTSDLALFRVDPETAIVIRVGSFDLGGEQLYALTFLPPGEYSPDRETLVAATNAGAYYEVDRETAATRYMGQYPNGWQSSGDIVSVAGLGTFATAKREDYPADVLVQMFFASDGSTSVTVLGPVHEGDLNFSQIFGVGYWGRVLYGFSNSGQLIEIDRETGAGRLVTDDTGAGQFWGAGVTTIVPVLI